MSDLPWHTLKKPCPRCNNSDCELLDPEEKYDYDAHDYDEWDDDENAFNYE